MSSFSLTGHSHYTINKTGFETGKFRPEIWSAASSNNASEAGRGLSPFSHFCLVVRDLCQQGTPFTDGQYKTWTADYGLRTGYKIEILGGGSLNQEPDKNAIFYTHYRHGHSL